MKTRHSFKLKSTVSAVMLIVLSACGGSSDSPDSLGDSDDGSGGGLVIGTGVMLEGTTTSTRLFASNEIEVRSASGERSTGTTNTQGQFQIQAGGSGPWLVRSNLGNDLFLYGIASDTNAESVTQNVHSYSDAVVRNFFANQNLDIDSVFNSAGALTVMPTASELDAIYNTIISVVADVIDNYSLTGADFNTDMFAANGTGIDEFIKQNPVILNDNAITISIFDPANDAASIASEELSLDTDLTAADNIAPSAPTDLRALPSASDEITLVWTVANDNIGVARYAIFRDGVEVATTPYPVFVDGGLDSNAQVSYSVFAIDAEGNTSVSSTLASAAPLAAVDTTAPPSPASVLLDTRRGSLDLTWTQTNIGDVASYSVQRGFTPTDLSDYLNVNSTFLFDEAVNAGVQYCYTITAEDASGNSSTPTGVSCATAPGDAVSPTNATTTQPPTMVAGDGLTAPELDVSSVSCTTNIEEVTGDFIITTLTTVPAGCYITTRDVLIDDGANLTFEPGAIVKFGEGDGIEVRQGASLTARGTENNPIVFSSTDPTPGFWDGIRFDRSNSLSNVLDHVQIEYAGSNEDAGIRLVSGNNDPVRAAISNTTVRFTNGPGILLTRNVGLASFDGNRLTGNTAPVLAHGLQPHLLDQRTSYTGNTNDAILIRSLFLIGSDVTISADTTWPGLAVPYESDDLVLDANLTLEPGTTILFRDGEGIRASGDGSLTAVGTAEQPILLTGLSQQIGSWSGLEFDNTDIPSQLTHVTISLTGSGNSENSAVILANRIFTEAQIGFNNVTISDNLGFGLFAGEGANITEFTNMTITGNDSLAHVAIVAADIFNNSGNYTGNTLDAIDIEDGDIDSSIDVVLSNSTVPYHAPDIDVDGTLTLEAGVTMAMDLAANFEIASGGTLIANGEPGALVSIIGQEPIQGYWNGLNFARSESIFNRLSNTLIADGGDDVDPDDAANIRFACSSLSTSRVSIENSRIENSLGFGIRIPNDNCIVNIDEGTTFSGNALGDINRN